jgi:hypothetical protein
LTRIAYARASRHAHSPRRIRHLRRKDTFYRSQRACVIDIFMALTYAAERHGENPSPASLAVTSCPRN